VGQFVGPNELLDARKVSRIDGDFFDATDGFDPGAVSNRATIKGRFPRKMNAPIPTIGDILKGATGPSVGNAVSIRIQNGTDAPAVVGSGRVSELRPILLPNIPASVGIANHPPKVRLRRAVSSTKRGAGCADARRRSDPSAVEKVFVGRLGFLFDD